MMPGRSRMPASASIVAGRPLSQVAMPMTPDRRGSERISRRIVIAASLRYGRLSNMPVVPCVRPSHGSLHIRGERHDARRAQRLGGGAHEQADLPVAGVVAERDRRAVLGAQAALRAEDQELRRGRPRRGSSPCRRPASCRTGCRSARRSSISAVIGSRPCGPARAGARRREQLARAQDLGERRGRRGGAVTRRRPAATTSPSISRHILPVGFWFASSGGRRCGRTSS